MDIKNFYSFGSRLVSSTIQVSAINLRRTGSTDPDQLEMYNENKLIRGDCAGITFPVLFKQEYGKKQQDILDTGWPSLYVISKKMRDAFEDQGLTGWATFPVQILDKKEKEIHGYCGLSITGRCGGIDYEKSEIIERRLVPDGPLVKYYKGLNAGLDEWDGSDFFMPEKTLWIIVTEKVSNLLKRNAFTNVSLKRLSEIEINEDTVKVALSRN